MCSNNEFGINRIIINMAMFNIIAGCYSSSSSVVSSGAMGTPNLVLQLEQIPGFYCTNTTAFVKISLLVLRQGEI